MGAKRRASDRHDLRVYRKAAPSDAVRVEQLTAQLRDANQRIAELEERVSVLVTSRDHHRTSAKSARKLLREAVGYLRPIVECEYSWPCDRLKSDDEVRYHGLIRELNVTYGHMRSARAFLASLDAGEDAPSCAQDEAVDIPFRVERSGGGWTVRDTRTGSASGWFSRYEEAEEDAERANLQAISAEDAPSCACGGPGAPASDAEAPDTTHGTEAPESGAEPQRAPLSLEAKLKALLSVCRDGGFSWEFTASAVARMVRGHLEHSGGDQGDPHLDFLAEAREEGLDIVCYLAMHRANGGDVLDKPLGNLCSALERLEVS